MYRANAHAFSSLERSGSLPLGLRTYHPATLGRAAAFHPIVPRLFESACDISPEMGSSHSSGFVAHILKAELLFPNLLQAYRARGWQQDAQLYRPRKLNTSPARNYPSALAPRQTFLQTRWIAGSSPAMTTRVNLFVDIGSQPHPTLLASPPSRQNLLCCPASPRPGIRTIFCASETTVPMRCAVRTWARRIESVRSADAGSTT
jgi:hypothetical protein